ncbi:unnamed protein product [Lymnaea stagnalis]|uniref:Fibronectin type-III domain-containing protein n=1 Tax=Lymnaea stagnalis TaxID=6523 RepID=A0AAV2HZJ8_LYMST
MLSSVTSGLRQTTRASFSLSIVVALLHQLVSSYSTEDFISHANRTIDMFDHFREPYDKRNYGILDIDVIEATTSSLHVTWKLTNMSSSDSVMESTVICETTNGRIVSDKLHSATNSFHFQFLTSDTRYIVCVYVLEKSTTANTSILHYNCQPFSTIPLVRADSIVGVILTLGYFGLMVVMGYAAWWRKMKNARRNGDEDKRKLKDADDSERKSTKKLEKYGSSGITNFGGGASGDEAEAKWLGENGVAASKSSAGCSGATTGCVGFSKEEEEDMVYYNAKNREISF